MRVSASACLGSGGGGSGSSVDKDDFFEDPKSWPPGFRFHPTDEELILYYLKRKICRRRLKINCIADIDVYKCHPEELPGQSVLKTGDRQWFFFSPRDRKYPNGGRANRGTKYGYWKATGKDRSITWNSRSVGVKKTLVFYTGRAPSGERTDWVMHEYTMEEEELKRCKDVQDYYALYKVFKKSGPGPKNGEQYGAPFKEEDWVDDGELVDSNTPKPANRLLQNGCVDNGELVENNTPNSKNQLLQNGWVDTGELVENNTPRPENQVSQNGYVSFESSAADPSQPPLDDLVEFFRQMDNVPQINQPSNDGFACLFPQFDGVEETRSTIMGPSQGEIACADPVSWYPNQNQFDAHTSFNATQSATSCLPSYPYEAPEVTSSSNVSRQDPFNIDDVGFLEMNDLVGTPPSSSGIINAGENPHIEPMDGSGSRDLFFDANMFPQDMESFDQGIGSDPYFDNSTFVMSNLDPFYPQTQLNQEGHDISQLWMYDQSFDVFHSAVPNQVEIAPASSASVSVMHAASSTNHLHAERQDQNENEDVDSWFSSAISSFLGSVPTRPALAAENPLNRAFVRMSSFSRVTIAARETNVPTRAEPVARRRVGKNRGFLFFSLLGVFCGVLWMMARH